jgi:hypothetical protein
MCSFLNRNRSFVDPKQCQEIPKDELQDHVPTSVTFPIEQTPVDGLEDFMDRMGDLDGMIVDIFSATSVHDDE